MHVLHIFFAQYPCAQTINASSTSSKEHGFQFVTFILTCVSRKRGINSLEEKSVTMTSELLRMKLATVIYALLP